MLNSRHRDNLIYSFLAKLKENKGKKITGRQAINVCFMLLEGGSLFMTHCGLKITLKQFTLLLSPTPKVYLSVQILPYIDFIPIGDIDLGSIAKAATQKPGLSTVTTGPGFSPLERVSLLLFREGSDGLAASKRCIFRVFILRPH